MTLTTIGLFLFSSASATLMITSQKLLAGQSAYRVYVVANGAAFVVSLLAYRFLDAKRSSIQRDPWMIVLGVALVALNLGYIRLYQQDINLAYVPLITTSLMTVFAIGVGFIFFQESFTRQAMVGMVVIGLGLRLMTSS